MHEYQHVFNRLKKLTKSIEHIAKENIELKEANRKLRDAERTYLMRLEASERVFDSLKEKQISP